MHCVFTRRLASLGRLYVDRLEPLGTLRDFKLDALAFAQCAVPLGFDRRMVDEHVLAIVRADEAEPFRVIEPFDRTSSHETYLRSAQDRIRSKQTLLRRDYRCVTFPAARINISIVRGGGIVKTILFMRGLFYLPYRAAARNVAFMKQTLIS